MQTTCPSCHGSGTVIRQPCPACRGGGLRAPRASPARSKFPPASTTARSCACTGEGEPSPSGGPPGDCYCVIHVTEHPAVPSRGPRPDLPGADHLSAGRLGGARSRCPRSTAARRWRSPRHAARRRVHAARPRHARPPRIAAAATCMVQVTSRCPRGSPAARGTAARAGRDREHPRHAQAEEFLREDQGILSERDDTK